MYSTTGLKPQRFADLAWQLATLPRAEHTWPPFLGLRNSLKATLIYLRRNRTQDDIAETLEVSQPTISRAIAVMIPLVVGLLNDGTPTAEDLTDDEFYIVDGTLLPCWPWTSRPELWSGKHKTTGPSVQVVIDATRHNEWISDPTTGTRHDMYCLVVSGVLDTVDVSKWMGDKGYIGLGMTTPIRKPADRTPTDEEKAFNTSVNRIRYVVEQAIANLKTWRIFHTDVRRPIKR